MNLLSTNIAKEKIDRTEERMEEAVTVAVRDGGRGAS
jgi:hypothetical protein